MPDDFLIELPANGSELAEIGSVVGGSIYRRNSSLPLCCCCSPCRSCTVRRYRYKPGRAAAPERGNSSDT